MLFQETLIVDDPRMAVWEPIVQAAEERTARLWDDDVLRTAARTLAARRPTINATPDLTKADDKARKERKKKRLQARATQQAQRKAKKKKKRH